MEDEALQKILHHIAKTLDKLEREFELLKRDVKEIEEYIQEQD